MVDTAQPTIRTFDDALQRARELADRPGRAVLGIAGAPAAGKSTLAAGLVATLRAELGDAVAHLPMDGFHLADVELARLQRLDAKGAPDTFDAGGYAALLERVRNERGSIVYAPAFERDLEQPLAGAIPILPEASLIISEGNYLLLDRPEWRRARQSLDEVWYCDAKESSRQRRLLKRHLRFGKQHDQANDWITVVDEPNAVLIARTASAADVRVDPLVVTAARQRRGR